MKWSTSQAQTTVKNKPVTQWPSLILAYGDDGGQAKQIIQTFQTASGIAQDDPFLFTKIDVDDLTQEPGKILEAAQTISFGGGLKLIKVEGITPEMPAASQSALTNAVKDCLAASLSDVLILISAPGLDAKAALVKHTEKSDTAAAIRCFHANAADLKTTITQHIQQSGKSIAPDALAWLQENLGRDRAITTSEIDKLLTYTTHQDSITLEDCFAVVAGASAVNVFSLCDAVGLRDIKTVDKALNILVEEGEDLNMIFALVVRHLRRIAQAQEAVQTGQPAQTAIKTLSPPVFFNQQQFIQQMNSYPQQRAAQITARALAAQKQARQGILPQDLVLSRAILSFAAS